ncbi:YbjN domain-containing protein [Glaesserella parasuis]|uniref:YbjN domain-containing protein n=1 Tax=Glaesserella parasuis TaxID=738 RepID=UPI00243663A2|nr:YbjN domain-containing protein [Glaesserella parasuis]MDG6274691.1 YbjN domain-containing protein [Glaesserella parasuis]MDG6278884.1 YbjN domain-containing protein [Glaesserella parasuis]MDG6299779.1 YbjN domain-containing protein [Glaesserella parasuis]MDG6321417.1 YbjN domain-containing protein [Glaesserella parasuis]
MKIYKYLKTLAYFLSMFFAMLITTTLVSTTAYAETKMVEVYTKFSDQQLIDIVKKKYPKVELIEKGRIRITSDSGIKLVIYNQRDDGSLTFRMYFDGDNTSLKSVNKWNATKRFLTAYIDKDGDLALKDDLDVEEGISEAYLLDTLTRIFVGAYLFASEMKKE